MTAMSLLLAVGLPVRAYSSEKGVEQIVGSKITVTGKIADAAGVPLAGVTVVVKGEQGNVAISDADGLYVIKAPADGVLEFSLIGMQSAQVPVNGRSVVDVVMKDENLLLDELVVVGFGSQRKENLTGAVSTVNVGRTMDGKPFTDPAKGLQGAVPGLTVTFSNGAINNAPGINIRGIETI